MKKKLLFKVYLSLIVLISSFKVLSNHELIQTDIDLSDSSLNSILGRGYNTVTQSMFSNCFKTSAQNNISDNYIYNLIEFDSSEINGNRFNKFLFNKSINLKWFNTSFRELEKAKNKQSHYFLINIRPYNYGYDLENNRSLLTPEASRLMEEGDINAFIKKCGPAYITAYGVNAHVYYLVQYSKKKIFRNNKNVKDVIFGPNDINDNFILNQKIKVKEYFVRFNSRPEKKINTLQDLKDTMNRMPFYFAEQNHDNNIDLIRINYWYTHREFSNNLLNFFPIDIFNNTEFEESIKRLNVRQIKNIHINSIFISTIHTKDNNNRVAIDKVNQMINDALLLVNNSMEIEDSLDEFIINGKYGQQLTLNELKSYSYHLIKLSMSRKKELKINLDSCWEILLKKRNFINMHFQDIYACKTLFKGIDNLKTKSLETHYDTYKNTKIIKK